MLLYFSTREFIYLKTKRYIIFEDTLRNKEKIIISDGDNRHIPKYKLTFKKVKENFNLDLYVDNYNYDYCEIEKDYYVVLIYDTFYTFAKDKFVLENKDRLIDVKELGKYTDKIKKIL